VKICDFFVGIFEFLGIKVVIIPPAVSIPRESGVTSTNIRSLVLLDPVFVKIAACTAAP